MNIFGNRVFMNGDLVKFKGRGGSKRTRENVWEIIEIVNNKPDRSKIGPYVKVRLIRGKINDSNNHEYGPGYMRKYLLKNVIHLEESGV